MITVSKTFHILVVEDNPADVYLLRQALKQAGVNFELTVIDDGAAALEFVSNPHTAKENFDLAILDLNLPSKNGIEVLAGIRQNGALPDMLVVILTSSAASIDRSKTEQLGVARFITKPADLADFLLIGNVLKNVLLGSEPQPVSA